MTTSDNHEKRKYKKKKLIYTPDLYKNKPVSDNKKFRLPFPCIIPQAEENIDIFEESIHVKNRLECKTYVCRNTGSFISCIEKSKESIIVGLKSGMKPFNIFERREGKSKILILNNNLETINMIEFEYGDVIQLKYENKKLYSLFSNGFLIEITDLTIGTHKVLYNTYKIVSFDVENTNIVFTDGSRIFCNDISKVYNGIAIKTMFYLNHIVTLDVNGRIIASGIDLNESFEIAFKYSNFNMKVIQASLVVFSHSQNNKTKFEIERSVLFPFAKTQSDIKNDENRFIHFFSSTGAGIIESYKRYKGKRKINKIFQIYKAKDEDCFHVRFDNFKEDLRLFIPDIIDCGDYFIFCTEDGLVLKVFYF